MPAPQKRELEKAKRLLQANAREEKTKKGR
jgi:hypothetical protein